MAGIPPKPWPTGKAMQLEPLVRRVLAPNPSPYTYTGTQSYIVGIGDGCAVIFRQERRVLHTNVVVRRHVAQKRNVAPRGRGSEIFNVATVQRIEGTIHHSDALSVFNELPKIDDHDLISSPF